MPQFATLAFPHPPSWRAAEQRGGKFARPDPTTGAQNVRLPMGRIGATIPRKPVNRLQHVQHLPSSDHSLDASVLEGARIRRLESGRGRHRLT